jgi:hypothetical protein
MIEHYEEISDNCLSKKKNEEISDNYIIERANKISKQI